MLWQLEEHHQVEDQHYFPVFRRIEPRLAAGFELLEGDHEALHEALGLIVLRANAVLAPGNAIRRRSAGRSSGSSIRSAGSGRASCGTSTTRRTS